MRYYGDKHWWDRHAPFNWEGFRLIVAFLSVLVAVCLAIAALIVPIVVVAETATCHQGAERQGTTGSYQFPSGCYYRLANGNELPASEYPAKRLKIEGSLR